MATNNLATTLDQEKITAAQLAQRCNLNKTTVRAVYAQKRTPAPSTQELLVKRLNAMTKKSFTVADIFPPKRKAAR